ncbi:hypothetical protein E4T49_07284 [Aureobasidium sp. EXF-10728]|nr:hypothetical protein E4T49_07284 [Aureobasidium sp. EXF-10728]
MKGNTLSVFIEANRFPPAVNKHRYSIHRAETDTVAERMLIIANHKKLSRASDLNILSGDHICELQADTVSTGRQSSVPSQSTEPPVLPRLSFMSVFNPFDEPISSPPSPVPHQLKPAVDAGPFSSTTSSSSEPPTNYLPFIAPQAPFDPYKEKYDPHPAGPYGAQKFKNRQTMSSAPFDFGIPVTPSFSDANSSEFTRFSDASPLDAGDIVAGAEYPPSQSQTSYSPPRTPLFRPFKIPRKPLPSGAEPFPPISYTPPGSPLRRDSSQNKSTNLKILSPVPRHPGRALLNTAPIRSHPRDHSIKSKPCPNIHKPLPPSPAPAAKRSHHQRQRHMPLNNRAGWEQKKPRRASKVSDRGMQRSNSHRPEVVIRVVTAPKRVHSDLKDRASDKWHKFKRA